MPQNAPYSVLFYATYSATQQQKFLPEFLLMLEISSLSFLFCLPMLLLQIALSSSSFENSIFLRNLGREVGTVDVNVEGVVEFCLWL